MSQISLRQYQKDALKVIDNDLKQDDSPVLFQAVMGAGKTVIICKLIERYFLETNKTFLILAHKQELVEQFRDSFQKFTSIPRQGIGVVCAGLKSKEINRRITIGTVQTVVHMNPPPTVSLLVIDEAHRVSVGTDSQYDKVIHRLNILNPTMRILGLTATPNRLGHGYIYGDKCRPGRSNLFPRLNHKIEYEKLKAQGFLAPLKGKVAKNSELVQDLEKVRVEGDYVLQDLGALMSQARHIQTAVDAIRLYTKDYKKICVFCTTIDHANRLYELLGDEATIVHSQLKPIERFANMADWIEGRKRIITSVNILVEGFDLPALDCLVMVRPTLSSALFLQSVGRVLRTFQGKDHGFLLDLTNNTSFFGIDLDNVKVSVPVSVQKIEKGLQELLKLCPKCEQEVHVALRQCACGFVWPAADFEVADQIPELQDVSFEKQPPKWFEIRGQTKIDHTAKKTNKRLGRLLLQGKGSMYKPEEYSLWFCFPDEYSGKAVKLSKEKWAKVSNDPFPQTVSEFMDSNIAQISEVLLDDNSDYPEIVDWKSDLIDASKVPF